MAITIAISNQKGGVGKTTITHNLSHILASMGKKVLEVDNDPQGNLTFANLGIKKDPPVHVLDLYSKKLIKPYVINHNLHFIGADKKLSIVQEKDFDILFNLADGLQEFETNYDYILIDCLPSFGRLHSASLLAAKHVLIPFVPEPFSVQGLEDLLETIEKVKNPRWNPKLNILGIIINAIPGKKTHLANNIIGDLRTTYSDLVFENSIDESVVIKESPGIAESIIEYVSNHKAAKQFMAVADEFLQRIGRVKHG